MTLYAEVQGTTLIKYPYTFEDLQKENASTNYNGDTDFVSIFPATDTAVQNGYSLVEVVIPPQPEFDAATKVCLQDEQPTFLNDVWVLGWSVRDMTDQERIVSIPEVSDLQFRLALNNLGLREAADAYINSANQDVKDWWDRALRFQYTNSMLQAAMVAMGKTTADLERLFRFAAKL